MEELTCYFREVFIGLVSLTILKDHFQKGSFTIRTQIH